MTPAARRPAGPALTLVVPARDLADTDLAAWRARAELPFVDEVIIALPSDARPPALPAGSGVRLILAPLGRASQMNAGAVAARSDLVFFVHGDTSVEPRALVAVVRALRAEPEVAIALSLRFDSERSSYRILERLSRLRNRFFPLPLGDQGLAMRRSKFLELGGFPDEPFFEDVVLSRRLRRSASIRVLAEPALTSPGRFERHGVWRTLGRNLLLVAWHSLGASPRTLVRRYYGADYVTRWLAADPRRRGGSDRPREGAPASAARQLPTPSP